MKITKYEVRDTKYQGISKILFFVLVLFNVSNTFAQFTIPEKPSFQTSVYDYANVLSADEKTQLEEKDIFVLQIGQIF